MIILLLWFCTYAIFAFVAWRKNSKRISESLTGFPIHELTVIVAFRNERENLWNLVEALKGLRIVPAKFIFVDDHSDDLGAELLKNDLNSAQFDWEIIKLEQSNFGKKNAILKGIESAKTNYCLTIDADVWLKQNYFELLPDPKDSEMIVLPVRMQGWTFMTFLFELEYASFQILQAMVPRTKPLMASGANLIFKRETYLNFNDLSTHNHRSSGDDQYALAQFIKNQRKINTYFDERIAVFTDTPESFGALLKQRLRWMGNNTQGKDHRAAFFSILIFLLNSFYLVVTLYFFITLKISFGLALICFKILLDFLIYVAWFDRNKTWKLAPYLPILSLIYPIYLLILAFTFLILGRKIQWKNRMVKQ